MNDRKNQQGQEDSPYPYIVPVPGTEDAADGGISRRGLLGFAVASLFLARAGQQIPQSGSSNGIPYRTLGRPTEEVSLVELGGYHLGKQAHPREHIRTIRAALSEGINI